MTQSGGDLVFYGIIVDHMARGFLFIVEQNHFYGSLMSILVMVFQKSS